MSNYTDTMLNLGVFIFIGVMIWLALKPAAGLGARKRIEKPSGERVSPQ